MYDSGVTSEDSESKHLEGMKRMAVRAQNNLVTVVTFLGMGQDNDDFTVKCSLKTCQTETSYKVKMVAHQLVRGLVDPTS